jgi:putative oxidoreductase
VLTRTLGKLAGAAPVVVRVIVGSMMFAHGVDKIGGGPTNFGRFLDAELGLPAGVALGWVVTFLELIGGAMLVVGLLSRFVAALLTVELIGATVLVTWSNGLIGSEGVGFERDLAYISGFLAVLFLGPGKPSIDHALGIETGGPTSLGYGRAGRRRPRHGEPASQYRLTEQLFSAPLESLHGLG